MITNYRTFSRRASVTLGLLVALAAPAIAALAAGANDAAVQKAAQWVAGQQQPDGSFPGFGVGSTADAIFGLAAAGEPSNPGGIALPGEPSGGLRQDAGRGGQAAAGARGGRQRAIRTPSAAWICCK